MRDRLPFKRIGSRHGYFKSLRVLAGQPLDDCVGGLSPTRIKDLHHRGFPRFSDAVPLPSKTTTFTPRPVLVVTKLARALPAPMMDGVDEGCAVQAIRR